MKNVVLLLSAILMLANLNAQPTIREGRLSNGMSYYLVKNANPKGRADFYIAHNVGALQEEDCENGLAHFLEHMAFNGTKNFPRKTMLNYLNRIGVRFGYNVNAFTSKERTVYNISNVPLVRESVVDSVLLMLHDWSSYISCLPEEIESERGVIREEWRRGDNSRSRLMKKAIKLQYGGSKYAIRDVIGDTAVINNCNPNTLIGFYHKWYRPDMQAVIISGDFDLDQMEKRVKSILGRIPKSKSRAVKEVYTVADNKEPIVAVISDPETRALAVKLLYKHKSCSANGGTFKEEIKTSVIASLISDMTQSKMDLSKEEKNPMFRSAAVVVSPGSAGLWFMQITISPVNENFTNALERGLVDIERIKKFRFTQKDLAAAKSSAIKKREATRRKIEECRSSDLADAVVDHFTKGDTLMFPKERLEFELALIERVGLDEINSYIPELYRDENRLVFLTCPDSKLDKVPSEKDIREKIDQIKSVELKPFKKREELGEIWNFDGLKGSKVVSSESIPKYNATHWVLGNGVNIYYVKNNEPGSKLYLKAFSKGGSSLLAKDDLPSYKIIENLLRYRGLGNYNHKKLKRYLATRDLSISPSIALYGESVFAAAGDGECENMMQLVYLCFNEIKIEKSSFDRVIKRASEQFTQSGVSDQQRYRDTIPFIKYGGSPYVLPISASDLAKADYNQSLSILNSRISDADDFVFFITGPQEEGEILKLAQRYIGSIESIPSKENFRDGVATLERGKVNFSMYTEEYKTPKSDISVIYSGKMENNPKNNSLFEILKYILSDRYLSSIREEKGGTYYVSVSGELSSIPQNRVYLEVGFETDPKLRDELMDIVHEEVRSLVKSGVSDEEFNSALLFMKKRIKDNQKRGDYLFSRLQEYINFGVDSRDGELELLDTLSTKEVQQFARKFFGQGNVINLVFGTK